MAMTQLTLKRIIKKIPEDFSKVLKEVALTA
jgi:hypothetical protein